MTEVLCIKENNCIIQPKNILLPEQCSVLLKTSTILIFTVGYSYYREYYDFTFSTTAVFVTSIMYWSNPEYNWKRNLDMFISHFSVLHHCVRAYTAERYVPFYFFTMLGVLCYWSSWKLYNQNKIWTSVYLHSGLHIMFNLAVLSLYSGDLVPICDNNNILVYIIKNDVYDLQLCSN